MHSQKNWCACVPVYDGSYLTMGKKHQPQMSEDWLAFFADAEAEPREWQDAKSVQKGHGRLEIRERWASTQMKACFETQWAGVAQVCRLRRCVKDAEKEREELVSGVTNVPRKHANAARLLS